MCQLPRITCDTWTSLPPQPSPNCCCPPLMGESAKAATVGNNTDSNVKNQGTLPHIAHLKKNTGQLSAGGNYVVFILRRQPAQLTLWTHSWATASLRSRISVTRPTRDTRRLQRSTLTGKDHIQGDVTNQSHLTQLFFVSEPFQEWTASKMRKRAQHDGMCGEGEVVLKLRLEQQGTQQLFDGTTLSQLLQPFLDGRLRKYCP